MAAHVTVLAGPARSGKTERLLARYRKELAQDSPGTTLWLAPTQRSAFDIRGRLLTADLPACISPGVMTFAQFAEALLAASPLAVRRIGPVEKRWLVERIINRLHARGALAHFGPIADRPGLVGLVTQFISELKRLEVWPNDFRAACGKLGMTAKDRELAQIYDEYQATLTRHQLYDAEGSFWSARELLAKGETGPFAALRLIVADGFTDFTRTQHEILQLLAQRAAELVVSLPLEPEPGRIELFAKSRGTLAQLRIRHPALALEEIARAPSPAWPALDHVERHVFGNPREVHSAPDTSGIEVVAAARQIGEVQWIARRIKLLLTQRDHVTGQPVLPGDVAVVFRSLAEYAPLVREVFDEYGLPTAIETGLRLADSPAVTALVSLLRLADEDWPFRRLLALLNNSFFRPGWPEATSANRRATERVIRDLQVPSGRERLLDYVRRRMRPAAPAAGAAVDPHAEARRERDRVDAATALPLLERVARTLDVLPERATAGQWWQALERLAEGTGLSAFLRLGPGSPAAAHDRAAWGRLRDDMAAIDEFHRRLGEVPPSLSRRELLGWLVELAATEPLPAGHDETGRIRVLSAASARALRIPYLFFAGLAEKSFPPAHRDDPLYSEAETRRLRDHNIPLVLRSERTSEEMLLFYEVLTRATRRLWLSYPALDEKGQELLPSPYLVEVERACGEGQLRPEEARGLSPLPDGPEVFSASELRVKAVQEGLQGDESLLAGLLWQADAHPCGENILEGLTVIGQRARREGFGPFEGIFQSDDARNELAARFGPEHLWSASALERYASCPFQFLLNDVLGVEPLADLELETDYSQRGTMVHEVLARLHRRLAEAGRSLDQLDEAAFEQHVRDVLEQLAACPDDPDTLAAALRAIDARFVHRLTRAYRSQHAAYDEMWAACDQSLRPAHFEVSFGKDTPSEDPLSTPQPLLLSAGDQDVRLSGRIDRIDRGQAAGREVFAVVDYKSGRCKGGKAQDQVDPTRLQLELYTIAAQELLLARERALPLSAGYWWLKEKGYKEWLHCQHTAEDDAAFERWWQERRRKIAEQVGALVAGVRRSQFPVFSLDPDCTSHCPYCTVCRVNHVRSLEKQWPVEASECEATDQT